MNKKLKFFNCFIFSDILLLNNKNSFKAKKKVLLTSSVNTSILDIFNAYKSFKQLIKILIFLLKNKGELILYSNCDNTRVTLEELFSIKRYQIDLTINGSFDDIKKSINKFQFSLLFGYSNLTIKSLNVFFKNCVYLISNISTSLNHNTKGVYKIYNNFNNFKKLTFIFILIKKIIKTKKKNYKIKRKRNEKKL